MIFLFLISYKREWNEKEGKYLGWERKRGMITQFNEYILGNEANKFKANTIENNKDILPKIKYIITLDADTDLILNSAFELVGAMAHILNKPIIDEKKNIVTEGHALIQPRIGINLDISYKTIFTKLFAGDGGIDSYTNAISDLYQDNFNEGIFTGKGIYDLQIFSRVLKNAIPENTVLSHDLLEGSYLRCGLATDILLMDGYPTKYNSFMNRLSRWIRGDWQIIKWITSNVSNKENKIIKNPLNFLSRYKIFDNLRRSLLDISILVACFISTIIAVIYKTDIYPIITIMILIGIFPYLLEILNRLIMKKEGEQKQKTFEPKITGYKGIILRSIVTISCLPYKAYISLKSIIKTIYRLTVSHKNLLEWLTSEEAEKQAKDDCFSYYKQMWINVVIGIIAIGFSIIRNNTIGIMLGFLWLIAPYIMCYISKEIKETKILEKLTKKEKEYVLEIGEKTWLFFKTYLTEDNNYLIPDNYQVGRKNKIVDRTSSTNIGLSILAVISAFNLKYINQKETIDLLQNIMTSVDSLQKWNGHLYNWYNIKTKQPLIPRYVSTVDSGNFVGYLYVEKAFLEEILSKEIT